MKRFIEKKYFLWLLISSISLISSWVLYSFLYATNEQDELTNFRQEVVALNHDLADFEAFLAPLVRETSTDELWANELLQNSSYLVNVFRKDSLIFWNNNSIPARELVSMNYDNRSTVATSLSNGFYLLKHKKIHDLDLILSVKLKDDFYYKNEELPDALTSQFSRSHDIDFSVQKMKGYTPISLNQSEEPHFFVKVKSQRSIAEWQELVIYLLYVLGIVSIVLSFGHLMVSLGYDHGPLGLFFPVIIIVLRYMSVEFNWISLFDDFVIFDPNLFATSKLYPNFGSLILSVTLLFIVVWWIAKVIDHVDPNKERYALLMLAYLLLFPFSYFISDLFESLVLNSSISLVIDEVFSLSIYSVIALLIIAGLFLSFFLVAHKIIFHLTKKAPLTVVAVLWFLSGSAYFFLELFFFQQNIYNALWPVLLNALLFYIHSKRLNIHQLKYQVLILVVISFYGAFILFENNQVNEHQKRDLYANQLITDQDPSMELEYVAALEGIKNNPDFLKLLETSDLLSVQEFALKVEQCCFGTYWERYEMQYHLFDSEGSSFFNAIRPQQTEKSQLDRIINEHCVSSSIADNLYYVKDYFDRLSYISTERIMTNDSSHVDMYITFRSKKIPEQIGFPRLLMNEKSYALEDLEGYSIARYSNQKLSLHFGAYNYPVDLQSMDAQIGLNAGFKLINDVSHYVYKQGDNQVVVISKPQKRWVEKLTTFSYLFLFFGVFISIIVLLRRIDISTLGTIALSAKIQIVLVSIVALSFLIFAVVAGNNVKSQYNTYTYDNLKEKVQSVRTEVSHKLEDKDRLDPQILGDYMNYILKKFSDVFVTDINLYSTNGELLATSQPKLYETGISSDHMNANAYTQMERNKRSQFIHKESIGQLNYLSAYAPFENKRGKLLGYLNLQHFAKQNAFENQLNEFVVAIINIAVLLLVITVVIAIFISGWITTPLRLIQDSFKKVELGKSNKPIDYKGDDEIGALVKDYNAKLAELELKAMQLARSERETAWREMAKQVAHEIKNPLTPMKLSLQHFQRAFSPDDPKANEKIKKISNSLVEQIDALTKIANEFSNFAKMPKANETEIDLLPVLKNVIDLYSSSSVQIDLSSETIKAKVFADKDLLIRVFNNLIKNAIQAAKDDEPIKIDIRVSIEDKMVLVVFTDNGKGIPEEIQKKIFVPNFTTKSTGAGLGLAMVKQIIHNHNGEIWFESQIEKGTSFYISLPLYVNN